MSDQLPAPHPVDVHVGKKVRLRRKMIGMSQDELGRAVGLTFQQIQKYEKGTNRISASKLYKISKILKVQLDYFFDIQSADDELIYISSEQSANQFLLTSEGVELAKAFPEIRQPTHRRKVLELVRALADDS